MPFGGLSLALPSPSVTPYKVPEALPEPRQGCIYGFEANKLKSSQGRDLQKCDTDEHASLKKKKTKTVYPPLLLLGRHSWR